MSNSEAPADGGPVLQLLASALQLWIRQQCQAVESLDLHLHGSALQLLRGRLEGVTLVAHKVRYQDLCFERVQLRSAPIQVRMGRLLKGQGLELEHLFAITGVVAFTGEGLELVLTRPPWSWLGDQLARETLGCDPLQGLAIAEDQLQLRAGLGGDDGLWALGAAVPRAAAGSVEIFLVEGGASFRLPMDPSIRIDAVRIEGGTLELQGEAQVSP